ncbi:MAG: hypothetical protein ACFE85_19380 [Candidatus Hodarchaeota archaeon]
MLSQKHLKLKKERNLILRRIRWNKFKIGLFATLIQVYSAPIKVLSPTKLLLLIRRLQEKSKKEFSRLTIIEQDASQKIMQSKLLKQELTTKLGFLELPSPHYAIEILPSNSYSFPRRNDTPGRYKSLSGFKKMEKAKS